MGFGICKRQVENFLAKKMGIQAEISKGLASSILFSLSIG